MIGLAWIGCYLYCTSMSNLTIELESNFEALQNKQCVPVREFAAF